MFSGVCFILQHQQPHCALLSPGYCGHLPVPCRAVLWVIPGCQPWRKAEVEAVPHISFAILSPGQAAGYTEGLLLCSTGGD